MLYEFEPEIGPGGKHQWPFRDLLVGDIVHIKNPLEWQRARGAAHIQGIDNRMKFRGRMDKAKGIMIITRIK